MTAEIAILNNKGVALAADSAVSIGNKVYNSANKLFHLHRRHPVGIMIYGNSELMGIPWETLIKMYRDEKQKEKNFTTIEEHGKDFIKFIKENVKIFTPERQGNFLKLYLTEIYKLIFDEFLKQVTAELQKGTAVFNTEKAIKILESIIDIFHNYFNNLEFIVTKETKHLTEFITKNKVVINEIIKQVFVGLVLTEPIIKRLEEIVGMAICKNSFETVLDTGIVITGFGKDEIVPSIVSYDIGIIYNNQMRYSRNDLTCYKNEALIKGYAQTDMIDTFVNGVNPSYEKMLQGGTSQLFQDFIKGIGDIPELKSLKKEDFDSFAGKIKDLISAVSKGFNNRIEDYILQEHSSPIYRSVGTMPKEELAIIAESLVYLTYIKRKTSINPETVGGAIDVAVISKGDGFIWIKRKHYFESGLNPHFFYNNYNTNK